MRPADLGSQVTGRSQPGGMIQPAGKHGPGTKPACFPGKNNENGLRDVPGGVRVAGLPQRGGKNQVHVPRHQCRKCVLRILKDVLPQQFHVSHFLHLPINVRCREKVPCYFLFPGSVSLAKDGHGLVVEKAVSCRRRPRWMTKRHCFGVKRSSFGEKRFDFDTKRFDEMQFPA